MKNFNFIVNRICANTPPSCSKRASRYAWVLVLMLTLGVGQMWGAAGDEITRIANIVNGKTYYIKGVRSSTTYYLTFTDATGSQSGTESATTAGAVPITFTAVTGGYNLTTPNGYYIAPGTSNGKINVSNSAITVTAANSGNSKIKLSIVSGSNTWAIQKNTSAANFGGYKNSGADITLIEAASCTPLTMSTVIATPGNQQITLSWTHVTNASSYTVTCKNGNANAGSIGNVTSDGTTRTCVISNLTNGTEYTWSVEPVGSGTYCSSNTPAVGTATPNQTRTITYYDKDGQHSTSLTDGTNIATALNALYGVGGPTSCNTEDYEYFVGWKDGEISGTATSVTLLSTEVVNATTAAKTYYAVWSDKDPSASSWSVASSIAANDVILLTYVSGNTKKELTSVDYINTNLCGIVSDFTTSVSGTFPLTVVAGNSDGSFSFKNGNNYLSWSSGNTLSTSGTKNNASSYTVSISNGIATIRNVGTNSRYLRYNTQSPRICWYENSSANITIYKQASISATYITTCCTPLGSINGSVSVTNQTVSWSAVTDASGYKVKVGTGDWSDIGNVTSKTFDLPCGGDTYNVYVMAYNNNNPGHCTGDGPASNAIQVTSAACTEPAITVDPNALTGLNYIVNAGPSAAQSFSISGTNLTNGSLTISAPTDYEVSKTSATSGFGNSVSVSANGTLTATNIWVRLKTGKAVGNYNNETVSINGCGLASAVNVTVSGSVLKPTITATPTSISDWSTQTGSAPSPATKTITVTGSNLKANISASLTAGSDYFTITPSGLAQSEGSVNGSVVIGVKAAAYASAATREGTLLLTTTDGDNVEVSFSLTVADDPREKFTLLTSSNKNEIVDGTRIVIVEADRDYAMNRTQDGTNGHGYIGSTNQFSFQSENTIITLEVSNSVEILTLEEISDGVYALKTESTSKYLTWNGGSNNKFSEIASYENEANALWTVNVDGAGHAQICANSGSGRYIGYNNSNTMTSRFRAYSDNSTYPIYAYFKASTTPKVNISGTLDAFTYMRAQGPSAAQSFKVRGNNLSENLVVTAPTNYEVCKTENGSYTASVEFEPTAGSVAQTDVYIRLKSGLGINTYNGNITVSSTGADNKTLDVAGSVTTPIYTVTLNTNGGTIEDGHDVTSYTEGVGATLPTAEYISKSGFSFEGWYANSDLETGGVQTTIATNATGAKEYWAKWTELPGYDITWLVDGEPYTGGEPDVHVVYDGSISKLPSTPTSLDITSKTFVGWTTAPVNEKQANAPSPLYTAANQIPGNITENKIFYAVFAQETYSGTFTKVTVASTLAAGDRLLIYASNYAAGTLGSNAYLSRESVTMSNNEITNKGNASVWVLGGTSGAWTLTSNEGTLKCYGTSNNNLSMSEGTGTWNITISSGNALIANTEYTSRYIQYNGGNSPRFSSYANGTSGITVPQLYREGTSLNDYTTKFVKPVAVTGVTLNKDATTLAIGATETLTATVAPQNATNKNVSWGSNAEGVATVEAGVVTAVAAGEATITVTTEDGSFTDECVVTVLPTVETPTFSPAAGAINKGTKVEISCGTADATILYSLDESDPSVAYPEGGVTINANCTLKAKATKANYTTSAVSEAAYTIIKEEQTVSFAESAISFRLESDEYNAFTGQTASSTYGSAVITYASSNTSVAEVDENTGAVTLKGVKGTTTITATAAEDDDYQSDSETYTITVLRAGKTRTGDFKLVTNANQLEDGDYILLTSETQTSYNENPNYAYVFNGISGSQGNAQSKYVVNDEITYSQFLAEGNTAKIITLEKVTVGNIDYWAFNYGTESDIYIKGTESTSSAGLASATSTTGNYVLWSIAIGEGNVATVINQGNDTYKVLSFNGQAIKAYKQLQGNSLRIYKQKDKNKLPQTLSFATPAYEFPLNESAYTSFAHQTVSGAHTAVTYTSNNDAVAAIVENVVVLQGGVGTATITATAAEDADYEHASATYTITVTAALNTVTFYYYNAVDASAAQTALKEETSGAGITVPAKPADVGEYTFLGWAPATLDETQTAPNNLVAALQAGATYHPSTNEEYHAIYRRLENSDGRFYLMHEVNNTPNYAKAPVGTDTKSFGNTTNIEDAAVFVQTEDNKLYYDNNGTPRYVSSTNKSERDLDFTTNAVDAKVWTITESGTTTTFYSSNSEKYLAHNGNMWAAYGTGSINAANQSKDLTKVYLSHVYYSSTPDLMVSPILTWAQGNATHVMEIEETYDNAATATVGGEPVSVTYASSDPNKATVSETGVVTAILGGDVTITATVAAEAGVNRELVESYQVSITKKVPQIVFDDNANWKVYVGETYKRVLAGQVTITTDGAVTYTLSNNATSSDWASINSETGEVTGLSTGGQISKFQNFYVHTAETDMYQSGVAYKQFNVLALKNQSLSFGQNAYVFDMNESVDAFTNTLSGNQTAVAYGSDNTDVAEVDEASGEVTVHTNVCGVATITATAAQGYSGADVYNQATQSYTITVNYPMPTFSMESSNIKAPVSLAISGYDENTKLYYTDGEGDPATLYSEPLAISANKTIRAKATNADGSLVSPIASVTLTKVTPTVTGMQNGGTITLSSDENSLITYIILNQNAVTVAEGTDVASPVVFNTELSGTYTVSASAKWDVENGFTGEDYDHDFTVKGKGHLPISYTGDGTNGIANEPWATRIGNVSNYNGGDVKFDESELALIAAFVEKPVQLSYDIKHNAADSKAWSATTNVYKVQWSADGETYTDIKVYDSSTPITTAVINETFDLDASARYIKWIYVTKDSDKGGNVALNNIRITCEAVIIDGISVLDIPDGYEGDVIVEDGGTLTIDEETNLINLTVEAGGKVSGSAALEVNNLTIKSEAGKSGQVMNTPSVNGALYLDIKFYSADFLDETSANQWYMISAPFAVNLNGGFLQTDGTPMEFGTNFDLFYYDGNKRANTGVTGWTRVQGQMPAGRACLIGFNAGQSTTIRLKAASNTVSDPTSITLTKFEPEGYVEGSQNWNGVANPRFQYTSVDKDVQIWNNEEGENGRKYLPYSASTYSFVVGTPFFVQATGTMSLAGDLHSQFRAPKRNTNERIEYCVRITREGATEFADQMYVRASEEATNTYEQGHDMISWNGTSGKSALLWSENYGMRLAIEEAPMVNSKATYELGIFAPTAGTYTISVAAPKENATLYLTKNGRIYWNLTMGACELDLAQGQNNEYGLVLRAEAPQVTTGVDEINAKAGVQKVVIDEHVYILRGGEMYDMTGKAVK